MWMVFIKGFLPAVCKQVEKRNPPYVTWIKLGQCWIVAGLTKTDNIVDDDDDDDVMMMMMMMS